jgi:hypothetical protein
VDNVSNRAETEDEETLTGFRHFLPDRFLWAVVKYTKLQAKAILRR